MTRASIALAACMLSLGPFAGTVRAAESAAGRSLRTGETLVLDARGPAATTSSPLETGRPYHITVTGAFSAWYASAWGSPCGTPQSSPDGPLGLDAEVWFAAALCGASDPQCCCNTPCPHHYAYFRMDLGSGWTHFEPIGGPVGAPTPDHRYEYTVVGQGQPASFLNYDDVYTDNYGTLTIAVTPEPASVGPRASPVVERPTITLSRNPLVGSGELSVLWSGGGPASLTLHDLLGKQVRSLVSSSDARGSMSVRVDARGLSSGVYYVLARQGRAASMVRVVVLK